MKMIYNILKVFVIGLLFINMACSDDCKHLVLEGNDAFITSYEASIGYGRCEGVIIGDSVFIYVPDEVSLSAVKVKLEVSEYAVITPLSDTIKEWGEPVRFVVTSANKSVTRAYVVVVKRVVTENVFEGSVRLGTQKEVDGFGENKYTKVNDIILYNGSYTDPITDLSPLSSIREISGGLSISDLSVRKVVFEKLEKLGRFYMQSPSATKVHFPMLKFVGGEFKLGNRASGAMPIPHNELEEVYLPRLEYVGQDFQLFLCNRIKTLESLSNLSYVGNDVIIVGGHFTTLKGLKNLKQVNGDCEILGDLANLDGFGIERVKGSISIAIEDVTNLEGLKVLKEIGGLFELKQNRFLKDLKGLEHICTKAIQLESFFALESLKGITIQPEMEYIRLQYFPMLKDISALEPLKRITRNIVFSYMFELESLHGLENLEYVGDLCRFEMMEKLKDMSALNNLTCAGSMYFAKMKVLTQLPVFNSLTEVKNLYLENLLALPTLSGLEKITKITQGGLTILACNELTDVGGVANITVVNFYVQRDKVCIERNRKLASFCPILETIRKYMNVSGRMSIRENYYNPTRADITAGKCEGKGGEGISGGGKE